MCTHNWLFNLSAVVYQTKQLTEGLSTLHTCMHSARVPGAWVPLAAPRRTPVAALGPKPKPAQVQRFDGEIWRLLEDAWTSLHYISKCFDTFRYVPPVSPKT